MGHDRSVTDGPVEHDLELTVSALKDGDLKIYRSAGASFDTIRVTGGVAEVGDRGLTVLAESAAE